MICLSTVTIFTVDEMRRMGYLMVCHQDDLAEWDVRRGWWFLRSKNVWAMSIHVITACYTNPEEDEREEAFSSSIGVSVDVEDVPQGIRDVLYNTVNGKKVFQDN